MKIAFDLDDTLVPTTTEFSVGSAPAPFPINVVFKERLRKGTIELLKGLAKDHELWIYTTSLRGEYYIKLWFYALGIKIGGVINATRHAASLAGTEDSKYSKAPRPFGIDLLIDDQPGVGMECHAQGCQALIVQPSDHHWQQTIQEGLIRAFS